MILRAIRQLKQCRHLEGTEARDTVWIGVCWKNIASDFAEVVRKYARFEAAFGATNSRILIAQVRVACWTQYGGQLKEQNALHRLMNVPGLKFPIVREDLGFYSASVTADPRRLSAHRRYLNITTLSV